MRERMITRTVKTANCTCTIANLVESKICTFDFAISATISEKDRLKAIQKIYDTDSVKVLNIVNVTYTEVLYGMLEDDFIRKAVILPPRTATVDVEE